MIQYLCSTVPSINLHTFLHIQLTYPPPPLPGGISTYSFPVPLQDKFQTIKFTIQFRMRILRDLENDE